MKSTGMAPLMLRKKNFIRFAGLLRYKIILKAIYYLGRIIQINTRRDISKECARNFVDRVNQLNAPKILELGARDISRKHLFQGYTEHIGFDIHAGAHVDVVGDIHNLSTFFPENHFDVVYCFSVFEHLAMPWKAVQEINKVLKPGGFLFISTHPTYPPHAQPWDFWRFSRPAFSSLLNPKTGYEIVDWAEGLPCIVLPLCTTEVPTRQMHTVPAFLIISILAVKTGSTHASLNWSVEVKDFMQEVYPERYGKQMTADFMSQIRGRGSALGDMI